MSDRFRLVFRGEVLEGQHPAVVRKRLGQAASFDDTQLDKLFSGKPVVIKREAGSEDAARLQALFRKAGARLRVVPLDDNGAGEAPAAAAGEDEAGATPGWEVLPPGSDLLRGEERRRLEPVAVDATFTVAEVGADLSPARPPQDPAVDLDSVSFEVAPPGTDLLDARPAQPAAPPDVSHLRLADES